jgi:hypothetical protein
MGEGTNGSPNNGRGKVREALIVLWGLGIITAIALFIISLGRLP